MEMQISGGETVIVDEQDYGFLSRFSWRRSGDYITVVINNAPRADGKRVRKNVFLHKLVLLAGDEIEVDHINNNTLDNRMENLRIFAVGTATKERQKILKPSSA